MQTPLIEYLSPRRLRRVLWWAGGANALVLADCPQDDRDKFVTLGSLNLIYSFFGGLVIYLTGLGYLRLELGPRVFFGINGWVFGFFIIMLAYRALFSIYRPRTSHARDSSPTNIFGILLTIYFVAMVAAAVYWIVPGLSSFILRMDVGQPAVPDISHTERLIVSLASFPVLCFPFVINMAWRTRIYDQLLLAAPPPESQPIFPHSTTVPTPLDDRLESELEKFLQEEPNNPAVARRLIELKKRLGKHEKAVKLYDILIHADPRNVALIREKAAIYRESGDERLYVRTLKQADELTARSTFEENLGKTITIRAFEAKGLAFFADFEWEFQSHVNVLLGRNGYGKTHLLRALVGMLQYDEEIIPEFFQGGGSEAQMRVDINREARLASTVRSSFQFDRTFGKVAVLAIPDIRYIDKARKTIGVAEEKVTDISSGGAWHFLRQESYEGLIQNFLYDRCKDYFDKWTFDQPVFNLIEGVVRCLTDSTFAFSEINWLDNARYEILVTTEGNENHPLLLQKASQGTLSIVAMFGMIYSFLRKVYGDIGDDLLKRQAIIVIDEIDSHLHPSWQQKVLQLLRETFENVQFIVTAHSPLVIAGCRRNEVAVFRRKSDGRFGVEVISRHFIGATAAEIYTDVFNIEEKDQTYKDYDSLLPEKDAIRTTVAELEALASRSPEAEKSLQKYQDDLKYLEEFEKIKQKREAKETIEDMQMAYRAKAAELEGTKGQLQNLQEQARSDDQADDELAATIGRFLNEQPDKAILAASISDLLSRKNKLELAIPIREKVAELSPDNVSTLQMLAQDYLMVRRYEEVITVSQRALAIAQDDIVSLRNLATGLWHTRRFEEAETAYQQALQLHPDDLQSAIALASLLRTRKKYAEAAEVCLKGLHHHPHNEELTEILEYLKNEQSGERAEG
jgi:tetratricopeptide (TPR) repeat protein